MKEKKGKEKEREDIGGLWKGDIKLRKKRNKILKDIYINLNLSNINLIFRLVESVFNVGYSGREIKNRVRTYIATSDFYVVY